jgi:hypothetical protein
MSNFDILETWVKENSRYFDFYTITPNYLTTITVIDGKKVQYDFRGVRNGKVTCGFYAMNRTKRAGTRKVYSSKKGKYINADGGRLYFKDMLDFNCIYEGGAN